MQSVLNSAAWKVFSASRYDRITPLLTQLHWLQVPERIKSKLAVLVYKCLHRTAPPYLAEELQSSADEARQRLRSASTSSIVSDAPVFSTIGDRAFPVAETHLLFSHSFSDSCSACAVTVISDTIIDLNTYSLIAVVTVSEERCVVFRCRSDIR